MQTPTPQRLTLQVEGAALAVLCLGLYAQTGAGWGLFALFILAPDLAMLGYLAGNRVGAACYNAAHSYLGPLGVAGLALARGEDAGLTVALIWGAHIAIDRAIGYGLKYPSGFRDTHLQRI